jgi:hypothetical protein
VIAICRHLDESGSCSGGHGSVILYKRDGTPSKGTEQMMAQVQNTICLSEGEPVLIQQQGM